MAPDCKSILRINSKLRFWKEYIYKKRKKNKNDQPETKKHYSSLKMCILLKQQFLKLIGQIPAIHIDCCHSTSTGSVENQLN